MHTVLCLGTNDNVRVFDYYVVNLIYVKSGCLQLVLLLHSLHIGLCQRTVFK